MKGDFTRDGFDPFDDFTRVLTQQGRIGIDADANAREAIQLRLARRLAADLIGPHGGAKGAFQLGKAEGFAWDVGIAPGAYYVDGWRIEARPGARYRVPAFEGAPVPAQPGAKTYLAYLDVWERHVSALEHDGPLAPNDPRRLADVALGGQDSASRAQLVWALRLAELSDGEARGLTQQSPDIVLDRLLPPARGRLAAQAIDPAAAESDDPCLVAPSSAYRGVENQLYRVEIHRGGTAAEGASFVWSRENGAVLFAVAAIEGKTLRLAEGWRDARFGIEPGDIVALEGPAQRFGAPAPLFAITSYDDEAVALELDAAPALDASAGDVVLRRWDHRQRPPGAGAGQLVDKAVKIVENEWIALEDGISVRFEGGAAKGAAQYRPGDYWLIPARTAIGDILWPSDGKQGLAIGPHGIDRRVAPLGLVRFDGQGQISVLRDFRREFAPLAQPVA